MSSREKARETSKLAPFSCSDAAVRASVQRRLALLALVDEHAVMGFVGEVLKTDMSAAAVMAAGAVESARFWMSIPVLREGGPALPLFEILFVFPP
jgi:hypothetical protein